MDEFWDQRLNSEGHVLLTEEMRHDNQKEGVSVWKLDASVEHTECR